MCNLVVVHRASSRAPCTTTRLHAYAERFPGLRDRLRFDITRGDQVCKTSSLLLCPRLLYIQICAPSVSLNPDPLRMLSSLHSSCALTLCPCLNVTKPTFQSVLFLDGIILRLLSRKGLVHLHHVTLSREYCELGCSQLYRSSAQV